VGQAQAILQGTCTMSLPLNPNPGGDATRGYPPALDSWGIAPVSVQRASTPLVIAHRGASGYLPEHTLPGVALAHGLGADSIEQDVVLTRDGHPVVLHDIRLDEVADVAQVYGSRCRPDGHYYVIDFTLAELRSLRLHERLDPETGRAKYAHRFPRGGGTFAIGTLSEHIELIQGLNASRGKQVGLYVEIKEPAWHHQHGQDLSQAVVSTLARYGYENRTSRALLLCFDGEELQRLRRTLQVPLKLVQLLRDPNSPNATEVPARTGDHLDRIATYADAIGPSLEFFEPATEGMAGGDLAAEPSFDLVAEAHRRALLVYAYTFRADRVPARFENFQQQIDSYADLGIDGFITDFPDLLRQALIVRQEQAAGH
jgi:glycerophosphoryl diester phosphodiesterase